MCGGVPFAFYVGDFVPRVKLVKSRDNSPLQRSILQYTWECSEKCLVVSSRCMYMVCRCIGNCLEGSNFAQVGVKKLHSRGPFY